MNKESVFPKLSRAGLVATVMALAALPARADPAVPQAAPAGAPVQNDPALEASTRKDDLARLEAEMKLSDETMARLRAEIEKLGADRDTLRQQLVDTGNRTHDAEARALAIEAHLALLTSDEDNIHVSLESKRGLLVEVLASLQRIGRNPPPALLVSPDDALRAVRTAMLLGAVLPQMRRDMQKLASELTDLARVRTEIGTERDALRQTLQDLAETRTRTQLLVEERQKVLAQEQNTLAGEQQHASALAAQAANLKDLIARMEREVPKAREAAASADAANADDKARSPRASLAALKDPSRLTPALPFDQAKGLLRLPVTGAVLRDFGSDSGDGPQRGLTLAAGPGATVTAPCDGWVVFAGNFRSYGQLLILNAGGGYRVVMAGMDKINVGLGQFVLTGEPVGAMASSNVVAAQTASGAGSQTEGPAGATGAGRSALYIEFRKDNVPIDPTPWWSNQGEKARG